MFSRWSLNRISYSSGIWIWMSILAIDYITSLYVYTILWTNSWIGNWWTLTALELWIWHTFVVVLVRVTLQVLQVYAITVWWSCSWGWSLHSKIGVAGWAIWSYSHCWVMLVKLTPITYQNLFLIILYHTLILQLLLLFYSLLCSWCAM